MKSLKTLIKLHKKKLEETVKHLGDLENKKSKLNKSLQELKQQILEELKKYSGTEYAFMLDNFMKSAEDKEQKLKNEIKALETQIAKVRDELSEQFAELKKFEIALQNRQNAEKELVRKSEVKALDEFNSIKFAKDKK